MKLKRAKKTKTIKIDDKAMSSIYNVRAEYADTLYVTVVGRGNTTNIRMTFCERIPELNTDIPVRSIMMPIDDFQSYYNLMTQMLENLRKVGKVA